MTRIDVQLQLPENLASEASRMGLLSGPALELLLRQELRRRKADELFHAVDRVRCLPGEPLSDDEINAQIADLRKRP